MARWRRRRLCRALHRKARHLQAPDPRLPARRRAKGRALPSRPRQRRCRRYRSPPRKDAGTVRRLACRPSRTSWSAPTHGWFPPRKSLPPPRKRPRPTPTARSLPRVAKPDKHKEIDDIWRHLRRPRESRLHAPLQSARPEPLHFFTAARLLPSKSGRTLILGRSEQDTASVEDHQVRFSHRYRVPDCPRPSAARRVSPGRFLRLVRRIVRRWLGAPALR